MTLNVPFRAALVVALGLSVSACTTSGESGGGNTLSNFLFYGGPTVPPEAPLPQGDLYCPQVTIFDGGSALRAGGAEASSVRYQIQLNNIARECTATGVDTYTLKIGVEGLALLGPAGGGTGRFDVPIRFIVRQGGEIIADRIQRVGVSIPAGSAQGTFIAIEDGIRVPPGPEAEVQVGIDQPGAGPARAAQARRARR